MATSIEQINDLIAGYTALKAYYEGQKDTWDGDVAAAQAAYNALANNLEGVVRQQADETVHVDQANGDDTNPGTAAEPLQTLKRASAFGIAGGVLRINLLGDYLLDEYFGFKQHAAVTIVGQGGAWNLSFSDAASNDAAAAPGFRYDYIGGTLMLSNLTIASRTLAAGVTNKHMIRTTGHTHVVLSDINLSAQAGDDLALLSGNHVFSLAVAGIAIPSEFQGLIVEGVAAGTLPSALTGCAGTNLDNF